MTREVISHAKRAAAARPPGAPHGGRAEDPAYYLISDGLLLLEKAIDYRVPLKQRLLRAYVSWATPGYLGTLGVFTALLLALPLLLTQAAGMSPLALALLCLLALIPASDLAVALVNRSVADQIGPRPLPRLELRDGVPPSSRTLVVMPTLLTGEAEIEENVGRLEIHYLANPDGDVHFALLSDWTDAPTETMPEDDRLLAAAVDGIARLNRRHGRAPDDGERFLLLHRRRVWNQAEGKWMGWERKRGKLDELNHLLRGGERHDVPLAAGPPTRRARRRPIRDYPRRRHASARGVVNRLVGTMVHPLNQPVFDPAVGRVVEGYGVLQPRITPTMPADRDQSLFERTSAGPAGLDPMPPRSPTCTRISSARARTPARVSTTWTRSPPLWPAASRRTPS